MIFTWKPPGLHILLDTKSQIAMFDSRTIHITVGETIASPFSHDLPMSHFSHFFPFPTGSDDLSLDHPCVSVPRSQQQGTPTMDNFFLRSCDILTQLPLTVWHGVAEWPLPAIVWVFVVKILKVSPTSGRKILYHHGFSFKEPWIKLLMNFLIITPWNIIS